MRWGLTVGAIPTQLVASGEQEPLLEGQETGNSVNATREDVESGGHSPDAEVRGTGLVGSGGGVGGVAASPRP